MGLDASIYREVELHDQMKVVGKPAKIIGDKAHKIAKEEVCYWCKFNALHKYINDNFNDHDNDNCVRIDLEIEDIEKILEIAKEIKKKVKLIDDEIDKPEICEKLLPTEDGFFFGSTKYDDYYMENIDKTIEQLERVIEEHEKLLEMVECRWDISYYYEAWY